MMVSPARWADLALVLTALPLLAASGYLFALAVLARRTQPPAPRVPRLRFDFVVPAHDEQQGIAKTVASLRAVDYPPELFRVLVVADNCADETAARAAEAGALVLQRTDAERRGKGYALELAFEKSLADGVADAAVVIDADTLASPNLLSAFAARLEAGEHAAQAHYGVRNPDASWRTRLLVLALALFHRVRSRARERLGVSCGLRGNGMCFSARLLREVPHDAFSLVEDVEYGIRLGRSRHRVAYVDEASVLGEMVAKERGSRSQRRRWEDGRRSLARAQGLPLLREGFARRSGLLLDLAADVLVPPLSALVGAAALGTGLALGLAVSLGAPSASLAAFALCDLLLAGYVLVGCWTSGLGARGLVSLAGAPLYLGWKLCLLVGRSRPKPGEWVRTARESGGR